MKCFDGWKLDRSEKNIKENELKLENWNLQKLVMYAIGMVW